MFGELGRLGLRMGAEGASFRWLVVFDENCDSELLDGSLDVVDVSGLSV